MARICTHTDVMMAPLSGSVCHNVSIYNCLQRPKKIIIQRLKKTKKKQQPSNWKQIKELEKNYCDKNIKSLDLLLTDKQEAQSVLNIWIKCVKFENTMP